MYFQWLCGPSEQGVKRLLMVPDASWALSHLHSLTKQTLPLLHPRWHEVTVWWAGNSQAAERGYDIPGYSPGRSLDVRSGSEVWAFILLLVWFPAQFPRCGSLINRSWLPPNGEAGTLLWPHLDLGHSPYEVLFHAGGAAGQKSIPGGERTGAWPPGLDSAWCSEGLQGRPRTCWGVRV